MGFLIGIGFNFRATAGYVTDTTDQQFVDGLDAYPKTYGAPGPSVVAGWDGNFVGTSERDRSNAIDVRLAGIHFAASPVDTYFRVDLDSPAAHDIRCAIGDIGSSNNHRQTARLYDNTTLITQPANNVETVAATNDGEMIDAAGTTHANIAAWVSSNAAAVHSFASTIAQIRVGVSTGGVNNTTTLAHFFLKQHEEAPDPDPPVGEIDSPPGPVSIFEGDSVIFSGTATLGTGGTAPITHSWVVTPSGSGISEITDADPGAVQFNVIGNWTMTYVATDATPLSSDPVTRVVTVAIQNERPVITSNGGGATAAINVLEGTTAVTTVVATDDDDDPITYSISGGADAALLTIDEDTGVLEFLDPPVFETPTDDDTDGVYEVEVQASDGTDTDTQAISVAVVVSILQSSGIAAIQMRKRIIRTRRTDRRRFP